jgi:hypothetical protein
VREIMELPTTKERLCNCAEERLRTHVASEALERVIADTLRGKIQWELLDTNNNTRSYGCWAIVRDAEGKEAYLPFYLFVNPFEGLLYIGDRSEVGNHHYDKEICAATLQQMIRGAS